MDKTRKKRWLVILSAFAGACLLAGLTLFLLVWNGVLLLNSPSRETYPVRGVDVSSYQGEIDWPVLAGQDIQFAFIKATEGSRFVDNYFSYNFAQAQESGLRVGAYHFFSYDSPGETQAENFIRTVPVVQGALPPVVDVEFYGGNEKHPPEKEPVERELSVMLEKLEKQYGQRPILYATEKSYSLYLAGGFVDYDIWIRNVITSPTLSDGRDWTFWQYTNRERLDGYRGKETFIDMNVFDGTKEEFAVYGGGTA